MRIMLKFSYFIWDFDGTLFNTYLHIVSVITNISKNNYNIDLEPEVALEWCRIGLKYCFSKIASDFNINLSDFQDLFSNEYWAEIVTH